MKELYNNYAKIIIHDFDIYFQTINLRMPRVFCPISLKWDLDIGKILVASSFNRNKQFDFSLLVNGKPIKRKVFPSIIKNNFFFTI